MLSLSPEAAGKHHTPNKKSFLHFLFYFWMMYIFCKYTTLFLNPKATLKEWMSEIYYSKFLDRLHRMFLLDGNFN